MKHKKILSILLVWLMIVSIVPIGTIPAFALKSGDYSYEVISESAKTCRITEYSGADANVTIPTYLSGYTVTEIGQQAFDGCKSLKKIVIPNTVTSMGMWTFANCTELESAIIPGTLESIPTQAFIGCTSLTSVDIGNGVKEIDDNAFCNCESLKSVVIPGTVKNIGIAAFMNCTKLENVTLERGITSIGQQAFDGCKSLKKIVIPNTVTSMGMWTFANCTELESAIIPGTLENIPTQAFINCTSLTSVDIGNGVKEIDDNAFCNCESLRRIDIPETVTKIDNLAFYNSPKAVFFGYRDSYAQTYAKENNIPFIALNGITSLAIQSKPSKTDYFVGDKFNSNGLSVKVNMYDGTSEIITDGFDISSPDMSTAGTKTVTVTLEGETASFKINLTALYTPALNKISNSAKGVTVTWSKINGAKSYNVYRKGPSDKSWVKIANVTGTSYTDSKTVSGTKYTYTVRAVDGADMSGYNKNGISILYLAQPTPKVANKNGYVSITWNKSAGAKGYYVYRKGPTDKSWVRIANVTGTSYNDKNVKNGTNYTYTVKAYNGSTYSSFHSGVAIKYLAQPTVKTANKNGYVSITWSKSAGASGYYVYRKGPTDKSWVRIANVTGTSYNDKNVKSGTNYTYTVKAYNGSTYSSFHSGVAIKYLAQPAIKVVNKSQNVTVTWNKTAGAKGYYVYRKGPNDKSWVRVANVTGTSYVDKNVKKNVKYTYTVKAYNGSYNSAYHSGVTVKH